MPRPILATVLATLSIVWLLFPSGVHAQKNRPKVLVLISTTGDADGAIDASTKERLDAARDVARAVRRLKFVKFTASRIDARVVMAITAGGSLARAELRVGEETATFAEAADADGRQSASQRLARVVAEWLHAHQPQLQGDAPFTPAP